VKHTLYNVPGADICFICKDPQETFDEMITQASLDNVKAASVTWLKSHAKTHEQRRKLLQQYDLFLVDDR
jgi:polysaccharide pyruvyl transferase WcaK-like protein